MATKDEIKGKLLENAKYDSGWIDVASELIYEYEYSESNLANYTAEQLNILLQANRDFNGDAAFVAMISNHELNATQMQILLTAKAKGVSNDDLLKCASPEIPYVKSNYVLNALVEGIDLTWCINEFSADQIYEIMAGALSDKNIEYAKYACKHIPADVMGLLRHALELGKDFEIELDGTQVITIK